MVGSTYSAGEGGDTTRITYSGGVDAVISWNGGEAGIGGENEGLGCSQARGGLH